MVPYLRRADARPLYRQHGIMTGAYAVKDMSITNKLVMTNKTPRAWCAASAVRKFISVWNG
jgi:hypothetical protein